MIRAKHISLNDDVNPYVDNLFYFLPLSIAKKLYWARVRRKQSLPHPDISAGGTQLMRE